jgi:type II secretory ATPase GspE/PulE/Tfp pilus assembly ATPase PilB-like protein
MIEPLGRSDGQYPLEFCQGSGALKLGEDDSTVTVVARKPVDDHLPRRLRKFHGKRVVIEEIEPEAFQAALARAMSTGSSSQESAAESIGFKLDAVDGEAYAVDFVNALIIEAIRQRASDIHFECFTEKAIVRFRIDGVIRKTTDLPKSKFDAVSSRLKVMAKLNVLERRLPQDGRATVDLSGARVDMRVSIVPIARGESIVLRLFNRDSDPLKLSDLGLGAVERSCIEDALRMPHGLVVVSGPTGSGKTTTLNAMLRSLPREALKIITIEDPIEYVIDGVDQIPVNDEIGLGFTTILRRVLRQDPDVLMIGEIRDSDTASLAVRAALTGHLVLTTLHTRDAPSVIERLRDMGVEDYLIESTLRIAFAQRLVRMLCPKCSAKRNPTRAERDRFKRFSLDCESLGVPVGCPECMNTGFKGRIGAFESWINTSANSVHTPKTKIERGTGIIRACLSLAASGITSFEEAERESAWE